MTDANAPKLFDLKTHNFDPKGRLLSTNHYTLRIISGSRYFERPVGSGNLFDEAGEPAGRLVDGKVESGALHIDFIPPREATPEELAAENAALQRELLAIKAEQAKRAGGGKSEAKETKEAKESK